MKSSRLRRGDNLGPVCGCSRAGAVLLALAVLSGCATTRYTRIYCLPHDQQLPAEPERVKDKLTGQADKDLTIVAGSAIRLRAYGESLWFILEGCREPQNVIAEDRG